MANIKYVVKNLSTNIVLLSYQNSSDSMWYYQVKLSPGQIKHIWCLEGTLSHSGKNNDVSITIDNKTCSIASPTPTVGNSNPLILEPIYYPGSIGVIYTLKSKYPSDNDITVYFTNILGTIDNGGISIISSVTLFTGEISGSTQVVVNGDFTKLNDSSLFTDVTVTTDEPSQYFETPVSAPPLVLRPIGPIYNDPIVYLVSSCCDKDIEGYMLLDSTKYTPNWAGYVVVDTYDNCYYIIGPESGVPNLIYSGRYYKNCEICTAKFPCSIPRPTPTPTQSAVVVNPCDVTPTPTPSTPSVCSVLPPTLLTVLPSGNTFSLFFTTSGCCTSLTASWSSDNITWNNYTAGCGSPRTITIPEPLPSTIYFRVQQICTGCPTLTSNNIIYYSVTKTPLPTPTPTTTIDGRDCLLIRHANQCGSQTIQSIGLINGKPGYQYFLGTDEIQIYWNPPTGVWNWQNVTANNNICLTLPLDTQYPIGNSNQWVQSPITTYHKKYNLNYKGFIYRPPRMTNFRYYFVN
jgi:hypothetical protein